jgi:hypothetical protein
MAAVKRPLHKKAHLLCPYPNWSACDKAADDAKADWDAMQQVLLAYRIASEGRRLKEDNQFANLIDYIGGHVEVILNKEGNPNRSTWVTRLLAAIERFKAGDLPAYNLYGIPGILPDDKEA